LSVASNHDLIAAANRHDSGASVLIHSRYPVSWVVSKSRVLSKFVKRLTLP
jgi:hypothetical protein